MKNFLNKIKKYVFLLYNRLEPLCSIEFKNKMLIENITRLKIVGVVGSFVNLIILFFSFNRDGFIGFLRIEGILRILWIISSILYIFLVRKSLTLEEIKLKHRIIFMGAATLSLIFSSLITVFLSIDHGYTFLFIINMLITGSLFYLSHLEMLSISIPSFLILLFAIGANQPTTLIKEGNMINIGAVTVFSIAISYLNFKSQLLQFQYQQIIKNQNNELRYLAEMDGLTNIYNRRKTNEIFDCEWTKAIDEDLELSLMMLDIDFFKLYNDTYGHPQGDECLKKVVEIITSTITKENCTLGRYGGEEFLLILPYRDINEAIHLAEIICKGIYSENIPHIKSSFQRVTVSIGVSSISSLKEISISKMIKEADTALYIAKQSGRNKIATAISL